MTPLAEITPTNKLISFILFIILSVSGCASISGPLSQQQITLSEAEKIVSDIETQGALVRSFYSLGVVSIKGWLIDSDADILIAGIKDPFTMKIEITHSWGKPLLHLLIKDSRLEVLSFQEKIFYQGTYTPEALSRFLPGLNLDQETIWAILSSRPPVSSHEAVSVPGPGRISLMDKNGLEVETIYLPFTKYMPAKVSFPGQSLNVFFSDIREDNGVSYAGKMESKGVKGGKDLGLKVNNLSVNPSLPYQIFIMEKFPSYRTVNLDDLLQDQDK
jgi:hypothetical protein